MLLELHADPGVQILRGEEGHLFLLKVSPMESQCLMVSLVCVQPNPPESVFDCSFSYKWRSNHSLNVWLDRIPNSSLSDGLPEDCFCILPNVLEGDTALLKGIFINKRVDYDDEIFFEKDDDEMEAEDDDDSSYDEIKVENDDDDDDDDA